MTIQSTVQARALIKNDALAPRVVGQIIEDRSVRLALTYKSHFWFFHTYLAHYVKYPTADFQKEMFELTENKSIKSAVIVSFRGSSKSTIMSVSYPIWSIIGEPQKKFILILSQTQYQSRLHLQNLKQELESNQLLKQELGPFEQRDGEWGSISLVIPKFGARITVASSEQSIRGIRHGEHRPDLIICDDVEDLASVKTKEGRDKTHNWLTGEVIPTGDRDTKLIIIGNLLHEDSLLMRLKEGIEKKKFRGVFRAYPLLDDNGISLWPGKFRTPADVEELQQSTGNENAWQREYMLRIISDVGRVIHPEWIHRYEELPEELPNYTATGIDLAISEKDTADYTAMVSACVYGTGNNLRIYILPNPVNERLDFPKTVERIEELHQSIRSIAYHRIYIEEVGYQTSLIHQLRTKGITAEGVNPHGSDKRSRLAFTGDHIYVGKIFFPAKGAERLIGQLVNFGTEKHDDLADAFSILIFKVIERNRFTPGMLVSCAPSDWIY